MDEHAGTTALQAALTEVAGEDNSQTRAALLAALTSADLLVPTMHPLGGPPGWRVSTEPTTIQPIVVDGPDGRPYLLVFTDEAAILAWKPDGRPWVAFHAPDVASLVLNNGLAGMVIDTGNPRRTVIPSDDLPAVAVGGDRKNVHAISLPAGVTLHIGPPGNAPAALMERLRDILGREEAVREGYLYNLIVNAGAPHLTLGLVLMAGGDAMRDLLQKVAAVVGEEETLDMRPIDGDDELAAVRDAGVALKPVIE